MQEQERMFMARKRLLASLLALCLGVWTGFAQQTPEPNSQTIVPPEETVVVLGSLTPVTQGESARTVTTFDAQQHRLAYQDLEDYLRGDASVDIQQRAPAGVMADISVRGATFEQTLVLLNGLRMDNVETSHFNLDLPVPLGAIGTINVLHGAGSTLYGSDAIGGVADFVTWTPETDTVRLRAGGGSFGENEQAFLGALVRKRWNEVLAGSRAFSTGFIPDRDYRTEDASAETRASSRLGSTDLLFAGNDRAYGAAQFYGNYNSWERTKGWFAGMTQQFNPHTLPLDIAGTPTFTFWSAMIRFSTRTSTSTMVSKGPSAIAATHSKTPPSCTASRKPRTRSEAPIWATTAGTAEQATPWGSGACLNTAPCLLAFVKRSLVAAARSSVPPPPPLYGFRMPLNCTRL
jgi:outer membrane cobalamin receptor